MPSELFVSRLGGQTWAALRESGSVAEFHVEPMDAAARSGQILKARVTRVVPGIQSAFLDLGAGRAALLPAGELPGAADGEPPRLTAGEPVLVQIRREALGAKRGRASGFLRITGRLVLLTPQSPRRAVSRRIRDPGERERLAGILEQLAGDWGYVARTAAEGASAESIRAEAQGLEQTWSSIRERYASAGAPSVLLAEPDLLERLLRDCDPNRLARIVVDCPEQHARALARVREVDPALVSRVLLHTGSPPLFERYGLTADLARSLGPHVQLESGGSLVIEQTEALVCIDVNSGKFPGERDPDETALRTNLEAAAEVARQLRLRDLGGAIVVDFIDMSVAEHRERVLNAVKTATRGARARTRIIGMSEIGLLEMTRQRMRPGVAARLTSRCPTCAGSGRIRSPAMVAALVLMELRRRAAQPDVAELTVRVAPAAARELRASLGGIDGDHAWNPGVALRVEEDPALHGDYEIKG